MDLLRMVSGLILLGCSLEAAAAPPAKDAPDPDRRVLAVSQDGAAIGEISWKWVSAGAGKEFASSKADLNTGGSRYILRTHLARRADGTVDKYKKWLGLEGAKPDVIVFWTDRKVRIVSSLRGSSFTRTHTPPATFLVWDDMALHLLRDFVRAWRSGGDGPRDVLLVGSGAFAKAGISRAGVADVTMNDRAVPADVVAVEVAGQRLLVYADAEDELLGVTSGGLVAVRPGWTLGEVRAPEAVPPAEDPAPTAPATEEPPAGEAAAAPPEGEPAAEPPATEPPPDTSPRGEPGKPRPLPID